MTTDAAGEDLVRSALPCRTVNDALPIGREARALNVPALERDPLEAARFTPAECAGKICQDQSCKRGESGNDWTQPKAHFPDPRQSRRTLRGPAQRIQGEREILRRLKALLR